jgi:hypothetical protein
MRNPLLAKPPNKTPPQPADTQSQQAAARALLWMGAACGAALVVGGAWLFSLAFTDQALLPTRAGIGFVLMGFGSVSCWAGIYAAAHSRLEAGRLRFDAQARELFSSETFVRFLKACGHAAGITLLIVSWMAVYYPQGIVLR